jgi:hypothetical protein
MRSMVRGVVGLVAGAAVLGFVAFLVQTDPAPFARAVKEIPFPAAWAQAQADVEDRRFVFGGARFFRFFLVDGNPAGIAEELTGIVTSAGYTVDTGAPNGCHQNGTGGPTTCSLGAYRGTVHLWIVVWDRGEAGPLLRGTPGFCVVRIQAGRGYV